MANDGGGTTRWVDVAPERLAGWLESFGNRHGGSVLPVLPVLAAHGPGRPDGSGPGTGTGEPRSRAADGPAADGSAAVGPGAAPAVAAAVSVVTFRAADGTLAECHLPFPPLPLRAGQQAPEAAQMAAHAAADRTVGILLVRLGGYAAGVFTGEEPQLIASKVGSRLVHGRSAAGGTSQHRFARRREKQASEALAAAADTAAAVLAPYAPRLDAFVLGGDRRAMSGLRGDPRLRAYFDLATERFLTVPDPRLAVLRGTPKLFRAIRIRLDAG